MKDGHKRSASEQEAWLARVLSNAASLTASGQESRRHYLVPQFYLTAWSKNGRVRVTELDTGPSGQAQL